MAHHHRILPGLVSAAAALAATVAPAQRPANASARLKDRVEQVLDAALDKRREVAAACLVARRGTVLVTKCYGVVDEGGRAVTDRTLFDVGPLAKHFTAAAILVLTQRGALSLDDTIDRHFENVPDSHRRVTIRQLLTDTSAIAQEVDFAPTELEVRELFVQRILSEKLIGHPGRYVQPNDLGYCLAAALAEQVAGEPFEALVRREIFEKAGMRDSGFRHDERLDRRRALARIEPGEGTLGDAVAFDWNWARRGATGVVSTVRDLLAWDQALRKGEPLGEAGIAALYEPYVGTYGLGWRVTSGPSGKPLRCSQGGQTAGFRARFTRHVAQDTLVVLLGNAYPDLDAIEAELTGLLQGQDLDSEELRCHVGRYRQDSHNEFDVALSSGRLVLRSIGQEASSRLCHGQPTMPEWPRFYDEAEERAQVMIRPLLQLDLESFRRNFHPGAPTGAAAAAIDRVRALVEEHGRIRGHQLIGTRATGGTHTWFRVVFGEQPVTLRVTWHGEELHEVVRDPEPFPFSVQLIPTSDREFSATSLDGNAQLRVEFETRPRGGSKSLRNYDRSKSGRRGIVCRRVN